MSAPPTPTVPLDPTTEPQAASAADGLTPGTRLGRYLVVEKVGEGGAGAVYAAFDAKLDRKVALKLLQRTGEGPNPTLDPGWPRLVREARMLARLSDPEVVTVYDVGEHEGVGYLAMEFVEGGDLAGWIRRHRGPKADAPRSLKDALGLLLQAGEGLAAAHRAALIHGDFKPANVLIDGRGRAKVSDFGIARLRAGAAMLPDESVLATHATRDEGAGFTDGDTAERDAGVTTGHGEGGQGRTHGTGVGMHLAGTPAYMAPEQFEGADADERTDVFAYCTALFQAVYGVLPWRGRSLLEVAMLKSRKPPRRPEGVSIPRWLDRVLDRGLAVEPVERYPSMDAVLSALHAGMAARRRGVALGVGLGVLGIGVSAWSMATPAGSNALCTPPPFAWDETVAAQVQARFEASGHRAPAEAWSRVQGRMQALAETWSKAWTTACEATGSPGMQQRSMQCLERQKTQGAALVTAWTTPEDGTTSPAVVDRASRAAAALADPGRCIDASAIGRDMPQPDDPDVRRAVDAARAQLDEAEALLRSGRFADAVPVAEAAFTAADATGFAAVQAEAALVLGRALETVGKLEQATEHIEQAYFKGNAVEAYGVAGNAAIRLVWMVGARLEQHDEGLLWAQHARAALDKAGEGRRDQLLSNEAGLYERKGEYETAGPLFDRALEAAPADDKFAQGIVHQRYGDMNRSQGKTDEALAHYDETIALWTDALGASHPNVAIAQTSRASGLGRAGRNEEAVAAYRDALENLEGALGRNHPNVGVAYVNLGITLKNLQRYDEAAAATRRALEITIASFGPEHRKTADRRESLGRLLTRQGEAEAALVEHETARTIYETALEPGHPFRILNAMNRADAVRQLGRLPEALRTYESAFHEAQTHRPVDDPLRHDAAVYYGRALVESKRLADARRLLGPAIDALVEHGGYADVVAVGRFALARALVGVSGRRAEAIALARSVGDDLEGNPAERAALQTWLTSLGVRPDDAG